MTTDINPRAGTPVSVDTSTDAVRTVAHIIYGLQAASVFVFVTGLIAIVLAHVKMPEAKGTWVESHLRWQIRTFWYGLAAALIALVLMVVMLMNLIPGFLLIWYLYLFAAMVWLIYRVVRGWLRLADNKSI